jgi:hypothetical protein
MFVKKIEGCKGLYIDLYAEHEKLYQSGIKLWKNILHRGHRYIRSRETDTGTHMYVI